MREAGLEIALRIVHVLTRYVSLFEVVTFNFFLNQMPTMDCTPFCCKEDIIPGMKIKSVDCTNRMFSNTQTRKQNLSCKFQKFRGCLESIV